MMSNFTLDYIMPHLSPNGWKVLCVAIRRTIGWVHPDDPTRRKERDRISLSQFMAGTGIASKETVLRALRECLGENSEHLEYLCRLPAPDHAQAFLYYLNTELEIEVPETGTEIVPVKGTGTEIVPVDEKTGTEIVPVDEKTGTETVHTKEKGDKETGDKETGADPLLFELERATLTAQESEGNWADPETNSLADNLVKLYCALQGQAEPKGNTRRTWRLALGEILKAWGLSQDGETAAAALRILLDPEGEFTYQRRTYHPLKPGFQGDLATVIGRLLAGGTGYLDAQDEPADMPGIQFEH